VRPTKLVLIEGIPGSGKSTLAQFLLDQYLRRGIPALWHYEEERAHPAVSFHSRSSLQRVLGDLTSGNYRNVIAAVLAQWRRFAELVQHRNGVTILDGCFFGNLTWSLFPLDVPEDGIHAYLEEVERILGPCRPCLVQLYQGDVAGALAKVCARRGAWGERFMRDGADTLYARRRGWRGAAGTVAYWAAYRRFTDAAFARVGFPKLALENGAGDWPRYHRQVLQFLGLAPLPEAAIHPDDLERFVGRYVSAAGDGKTCTVRREDGALVVDGPREVWPDTALLPRAPGLFAVESLPFAVAFSEGSPGGTVGLAVSGPELLDGPVAAVFERQGGASGRDAARP
jgi:thymidylate kinase